MKKSFPIFGNGNGRPLFPGMAGNGNSRSPLFVTNVPLSSFTRTVNVVSVQDMQENLVSASEALVPVLLYGFLTKLDLDSDDAVSLRCGRCSGPMTLGNGGEVSRQIHYLVH